MPMKARYTVIDGEVVAEKRGGVRRQYVPDPLGSTVALLDNTQTKTDTFAYWPYGEEASRTGTTPTPLRFVGTMGYYRDSVARHYVRARYLHSTLSTWMSEDDLGFTSNDWNFYRYALNSPVTLVDLTGLQTDLGSEMGPFIECLACANQARHAGVNAGGRYCRENKLGNNVDDTVCNAVQHCTWMCTVTKNCGVFGAMTGDQCAKMAGDIHESEQPFPIISLPGFRPRSNKPNPQKPKEMDLHNNSVGRQCGCSSSSCYDCCSAKARSGGLSVLKPPPKKARTPKPKVNAQI